MPAASCRRRSARAARSGSVETATWWGSDQWTRRTLGPDTTATHNCALIELGAWPAINTSGPARQFDIAVIGLDPFAGVVGITHDVHADQLPRRGTECASVVVDIVAFKAFPATDAGIRPAA